MKSSLLAPLAMVVGLLLLALSFAWPVMETSTSGWTEEKAVRKQELNKRLHGLAHVDNEGSGHRHGGERERTEQELGENKAAAIRERAALQEELESVRSGAHQMAALFKWIGVTLVALGALVFLVQKQQVDA